ncbi:hypothetical protein [Piscinibacter sakaiensis]|uniref:hypothetical protein n=1 Tax=Piscinibacter sakaiensis TaxID=1547922 RepID=UPI00372D596A
MSPLSPPPSEPRPPLRPLHVGKYIPPPYAGIEAHIAGAPSCCTCTRPTPGATWRR